jgi:hypothetical protein
LGLAGETINAMILYLIMTSRLLQNILRQPSRRESGVGKNTLIEKVATLFPEDAHIFLSGMSKQALIYTDREYKHKHLIIAEAGGSRAARYNLRTLFLKIGWYLRRWKRTVRVNWGRAELKRTHQPA